MANERIIIIGKNHKGASNIPLFFIRFIESIEIYASSLQLEILNKSYVANGNRERSKTDWRNEEKKRKRKRIQQITIKPLSASQSNMEHPSSEAAHTPEYSFTLL